MAQPKKSEPKGRTEYVVLVQKQHSDNEGPVGEATSYPVWAEVGKFWANKGEDAVDQFIEKADEQDKDGPFRAIAERHWGNELAPEVETVRRWKRKK